MLTFLRSTLNQERMPLPDNPRREFWRTFIARFTIGMVFALIALGLIILIPGALEDTLRVLGLLN